MTRSARRVLAPALVLAAAIAPLPSQEQLPPALQGDILDPAQRSRPAITPQIQQALDRLAAESRDNPGDALKLGQYGLALVRVGQIEQGMAALTRAAGMAPDDPRVMLYHAKGLWKANRPSEAADAALKAARSPLATHSVASEANFVAGTIRSRQGSFKEAESLLRESLRLDPANGGALLNLGLLLIARGERAQGLAQLENAALRDPDNPGVLSALARVMEASGKLDRALELWERVVRLVPRDPEARSVLGEHYLSRRRYDAAAEQFAVAVEVRPADANAHALYAQALLNLGRLDEAQREAAQAARLGSTEAEQLLQSIEARRR
ncbi:MAG: tetratricopeptide repeat protein [Acidobacteria bacterium]|nr:tetratricopeptide repeat protein [Acidobacteriota bacterium]